MLFDASIFLDKMEFVKQLYAANCKALMIVKTFFYPRLQFFNNKFPVLVFFRFFNNFAPLLFFDYVSWTIIIKITKRISKKSKKQKLIK